MREQQEGFAIRMFLGFCVGYTVTDLVLWAFS